MRLGLAAGILLVPAAARADAALSASPFVTLDRQAGDSAAGLEVAAPQLGTRSTPTYLQLDLNAHYVDPGTRVGAYVALPITYVSESRSLDATGNATGGRAVAIGDVEAGAIYALETSVPELGVVVHAGVLLPTASTAHEPDNVTVQLLARPRDLLAAVPGFAARLGASPVVRWGTLFARADVDLDVALSNRAGRTARPVLTVAGGAGVAASSVVLSGELSLVHSFNSSFDAADAYALPGSSTAAVSARFVARAVQPYIAVAIPLTQHGSVGESVAVILGVTARLR